MWKQINRVTQSQCFILIYYTDRLPQLFVSTGNNKACDDDIALMAFKWLNLPFAIAHMNSSMGEWKLKYNAGGDAKNSQKRKKESYAQYIYKSTETLRYRLMFITHIVVVIYSI